MYRSFSSRRKRCSDIDLAAITTMKQSLLTVAPAIALLSSTMVCTPTAALVVPQQAQHNQQLSPHGACSTGGLFMAHQAGDDRISVDTDVVVPANSRRAFFSRAAATIAYSTVAAAGALAFQPQSARATMMRSDTEGARTFKPGEKLTIEEAKSRFALARNDLDYLLDNYADIKKGGGDNVRRYLGTVGVTSYMYGIGKVLKELQYEADDVVEYTEAMNEFNAYLNQAETSAYSSLFVEHSSAKGTPETFLATAREDVRQMRRYMEDMAAQLSL